MTEYDTYSRRPAGSGISLRAVLGTSLLAFIGGAALIGWLIYDDRLPIDAGFGQPAVTAPAPKASPLAGALPAPSASPSLAAVAGGMDQRIAVNFRSGGDEKTRPFLSSQLQGIFRSERTHCQGFNRDFQIINRTGWRRKMPHVMNNSSR